MEENKKLSKSFVGMRRRKIFSDFSQYNRPKEGFISEMIFGKNLQPIFYVILSTFFNFIMLICCKIVFQIYFNIGIHTINFFKGFYMVILSIIFIKIDKIDLTKQKNFEKDLIVLSLSRVLIIVFHNLLSVYSLKFLNLSTFFSISRLSPLFATVVGCALAKERLSKNDKRSLTYIFLALMIFLVNNIYQNSQSPTFSILIALMSSLTLSLYLVLYKRSLIHTYLFLFFNGSFLLCISLVFIPINKERLEGVDFICIILMMFIGCSAFFAHYFTFKALEKHLNFAEVINNCNVIFYFSIGLYLFDESITILNVFGSSIIMGLNIYRNLILNKNYQNN